jgi:PAS domain S-box-containing protein
MASSDMTVRAGTPHPDIASLYRSIFERATDAIAIIGPDGTYVEQNEAHARLTGWTTAELIGRTPAIHLGEETLAVVLAGIAADGCYLGEVESHHRDGTARIVELSAFPVRDAAGRIVAYVGAKRDTSARRAAEHELRRQLDQLAAIYRMTAALGKAPGPDVIYREALDCLCTALATPRASVLLFDPDGVIRFKAWRGLSDGYRAAVEGHSPWQQDDPAPKAFVVADVATEVSLDEGLRATILGEGIAAAAFVPLLYHGTLLGKFMVYFGKPHQPTGEEMLLAETVAGHVAFAIARHRADEALVRREREFATLAELSPDIIARFDRELRHLYVNPALEIATGLPLAQIIGRTNRDLGMPADLLGQWERALNGVFATGRAASIEFCYDTPEGLRWFSSRITPEVVEEGIIRTVLGTTRDVTALKVAEQRQRLLAEVTAAVVSQLDYRDALADVARLVTGSFAEGCFLDLARADGTLERLVVVDRWPDCQLIAQELERRYPTTPDSPAGHTTAFRSGQTQVCSAFTDELLRSASVDEEHFRLWKALRMSCMINVPLIARGRSIGVMNLVLHEPRAAFTAADVTFTEQLAGRVALAVDNLRLYEESLQASRTKSDFMATMSHELRTPLNAILGYADLLDLRLSGPLTDAQASHLDRIKLSTRHLLTVIEEILTFSRIEAGKEEARWDGVDVVELARDAAALVEPAARLKGLEFELVAHGAPLAIRTDPVKLRQVLINLLSNAVKFTDQGSVTFTVAADSGHVSFAVADTGPGIDAEHVHLIFEPFWQVHRGNTRRVGGTGLGLTVSRQLMKLLGGDLVVESASGGGSRFVATLPVQGSGDNCVAAS